MKRIISALLCVVMLLTIAPVAFANDEITYADCYMKKLYAGDNPSYDARVREDDGYLVGNPTGAGEGEINGVKWMDVTDDTAAYRLSESSVLVEGHVYQVSVCLYAKRGYSFRRSDGGELEVSGYFNDLDADVTDMFNYIIVSYTFVCPKNKTVINAVSLAVRAPIVGERPDYDVDVVAGNVTLETSADGDEYYNNGVAWFNADTLSFVLPDEVFEAGYTYRMLVHLKADDGYRFQAGDVFRPDQPTLRVSYRFLGEDIDQTEVGYVSGGSEDGEDDIAFVACEVKAFETQGNTPIADIALTGTAPVAGATPSFRVTLPNNAPYEIDTSENTGGFVNGVRWWHGYSLYGIQATETFEEDVPYMLHVYLKAKPGYAFIIDDPETGEAIVTVTFNGQMNGDASGKTDRVMVSCRFGYGEEPGDDYNVDTISLAGGKAVAGAKPNFKVTIADAEDNPNYKIDTSKNGSGWVNGVAWQNTTTGAYLTANDTFKAGYEYQLKVAVVTTNSRELMFEDEDDFSTITTSAFYNGSGADYDYSALYYDQAVVVADFVLVQNIGKCKLSGFSANTYYTGKAIKQSKCKLTYENAALKEGTDYTVTYKNNVKLGTASMIFKGFGRFSGSATVTFKIKLSKPKPVVTKVTASTLTIKWNKVPGAKYYSVFEYNTKTKKYTGVFLKTTGTSYTAKKRASGTTYQYLVRAYGTDSAGKTVASDYTTADNLKATTLCAAPRITKHSVKRTTVTLKWKAVTGAKFYRVYKYNRKTKAYTVLKSKVVATSATVAGSKGVNVYLVRAFNVNGLASAYTSANQYVVRIK